MVKATNRNMTAIPDTACATNASLLTAGTGTAQLSVASGAVTAGTVSDKTGYSLVASQHVIVDSGTVTTLTNLPAIPDNWITAAGINAAALNGKGDWSTYAGGAVASVTGAVGSVTAGVTLASSQHVIVDSGTVTTLTNLPAISTNWITGTGVDATAVTKIQTGLATPTNITAGTITTVTNLTNAPTAGDLTSTMKTSVTAAASAAAPTVALNTAQTLGAARALDLIADTSLTLNDALHCAIAAAAGAEQVTGTAYTVKTPHTATVLRTFTLDSGTDPTVR